MLQTGKFICNNTSAYLMYNADLETGTFYIESLDDRGFEFLHSISVGEKITLLTSSIDVSLLVTDLTVKGPRLQCKAIAE